MLYTNLKADSTFRAGEDGASFRAPRMDMAMIAGFLGGSRAQLARRLLVFFAFFGCVGEFIRLILF
jgi:hypothetical protein